jgi:hypothetical protein
MVHGRESSDSEVTGEQPGHLGPCVHTFLATPPVRRASRAVVLLGVLSVVAVPLSLNYVTGAWGTVVAILAALVTVACYLLSGFRHAPAGVEIKLFERGIKVTQGSALRQLMWNEVVEVSARRMPLPGGRESLAIVFEVVGGQPLLIMVGTPFSDAKSTLALVDTLSGAWLSVWCRRATVMLASGRALRLGRATLSADGVTIGDREIGWADIQGTDGQSGVERLRTHAGVIDTEEQAGSGVPFPSSARRLAELAAVAASLPQLPRKP